jgi:hypothetical protein
MGCETTGTGNKRRQVRRAIYTADQDGIVVDQWTRELADDRNVMRFFRRGVDADRNKFTNPVLYRRIA